ncbi:MAG: GNAT family N-acetyltransferase [Devosiaceae bacterium]
MSNPSLPAGTVMVPSNITFSAMSAADHAAVLGLHEAVFGPGRFARTAFRLRERAAPLLGLSLVARQEGALIGAVSMSRIVVGGQRGVLLGPLAVLQDKRDLGVGKALLQSAVKATFAAKEPFVLLVGDLAYYAPAGFAVVPFGSVQMPGPVDPSRLLVAGNSAFQTNLHGVVEGVL